MWQIWSIKVWIGILVLLTVLVLPLAIAIQGHPSNIFGWGSRVALTNAIVFSIVFLLATTPWWRAVWRWSWIGPLLERFIMPDINGVWSGTFTSNFEKEIDGKMQRVPPFTVYMRIRVNWFRIHIDVTSENSYSMSETSYVWVKREGETSSPVRVWYIYGNQTPMPESTDFSFHNGSAYFIVDQSGSEIVLKGHYWTDRMWWKRENTAGNFVLKRIDPNPDALLPVKTPAQPPIPAPVATRSEVAGAATGD